MTYDPVNHLLMILYQELKNKVQEKQYFQMRILEDLIWSLKTSRKSDFSEENRNIAFVDGGNGVLLKAPNYSIQLNRVYFSIFAGNKRLIPEKTRNRIEFFCFFNVVCWYFYISYLI